MIRLAAIKWHENGSIPSLSLFFERILLILKILGFSLSMDIIINLSKDGSRSYRRIDNVDQTKEISFQIVVMMVVVV